MKLANLIDDDRAVSPVIGVILMVAITVILAAVIGTFVLGLGDQVQQTTPQASFGFDTGTYTGVNGTDYTAVTVTHESGDTLQASDIQVTVDGKTAYTQSGNIVEGTFSGEVSAGSSVTIVGSADDDRIETGMSNFTDDTSTSTLGINTDADANSTTEISEVGLGSGETIRVVYNSPDSDSSATLAKFEIQ